MLSTESGYNGRSKKLDGYLLIEIERAATILPCGQHARTLASSSRSKHSSARKSYGGCAIQLIAKFNCHGRKRKISLGAFASFHGARRSGRHISVVSSFAMGSHSTLKLLKKTFLFASREPTHIHRSSLLGFASTGRPRINIVSATSHVSHEVRLYPNRSTKSGSRRTFQCDVSEKYETSEILLRRPRIYSDACVLSEVCEL